MVEARAVTEFERHASRLGPSALVSASSVARMFHIEGMSKVEIADALGISRYKVARILKSAMDADVVKIQIELPAYIDGELSYALERRFGLRQAIVVVTNGDDLEAINAAVAKVGAEFLMEVAAPDDAIGFAWGGLLGSVSRLVTSLPACTLVQATGAMTHGIVGENAIEVVRRLSMVSDGKAWAFYAPLLSPDATAAEALRRSEIRPALEMLDQLTWLFASGGYWAHGESDLYDTLHPKERDLLTEAGVCAEFAGLTFDADGTQVPGLSDRMIGITADQMRATGDVVLLATREKRSPAVAALLRTGLINTLITDQAVARQVLALGLSRADFSGGSLVASRP